MAKLNVCVIGGGVIGLSTAVNIIENISDVKVDIIAEKLSPNTTCDVAGGLWKPHDIKQTEETLKLAEVTFHHMIQLSISEQASEVGAFRMSSYSMSTHKQEVCIKIFGVFHWNQLVDNKAPAYKDILQGFRQMTKDELSNFQGFRYGFAFNGVILECRKYLPWLTKRFCNRGGRLIKRKVHSLDELAENYDIIVNCSGLGARDLVNDTEVKPAKGQFVRVQAPWIKQFISVPENFVHIIPRSDHVLLGGSYEEGNYDTTPCLELRERILAKCMLLVPSLKHAKFEGDLVGLRPCRPNIRLEAEQMLLDQKKLQVIHNYGHGGSGLSLHWGCALKATSLVQEAAQKMGKQAKL